VSETGAAEAADVDPGVGLDGRVAVVTGAAGGLGRAEALALGLGAAEIAHQIFARGSTVDANSSMTSVDPQISLNFGTSEGWSNLSAGVGVTRISANPGGVSESVRSINWGGGARWFIKPHFGVGFDVRFHHLAAGDVLPKQTAVSIGAGFALK